jgi:hypothetical protein
MHQCQTACKMDKFHVKVLQGVWRDYSRNNQDVIEDGYIHVRYVELAYLHFIFILIGPI